MKHELTRRALSMDSRGDDVYRRDSPASPAAPAMLLGGLFSRALDSGVQGQQNQGGGPSYQGLDVSRHATTSRRPGTGRFFSGSGSGLSRGAFPFSSAETRRIGAICGKMEEEQGRRN